MEVAEFSRFSQLPAELRLGIWEAAVSSPSMHIFDVCLPSSSSNDNDDNNTYQWSRAQTAFGGNKASRSTKLSEDAAVRYNKFKSMAFLDAHHATGNQVGEDNDTENSLQPHLDPSVYRWKMALGAACIDACRAVSIRGLQHNAGDSVTPTAKYNEAVNTVYLPGPDRHVQYNNQTDVMHICFPLLKMKDTQIPVNKAGTMPSFIPCHNCQGCTPAHANNSPLEMEEANIHDMANSPARPQRLLDAQWSDEMAEALRNARYVALDASQAPYLVDMASPLAFEEMAMLACTLHQGLELLYLVDYCPSRCKDYSRSVIRAKDQPVQRGSLLAKLNCPDIPGNDHGPVTNLESEKDFRTPDVIWGVGRVYREVFDLESMGWSEDHPAFIFARMLSAAICAQQLDATQSCQFHGVRVLIAEDK